MKTQDGKLGCQKGHSLLAAKGHNLPTNVISQTTAAKAPIQQVV